MEFRIFFDQISSLSEEDYEKIGFAGNPAYYGLRCGEDINMHIPREPLESELKSLIDAFADGKEFKHAYLYSGETGAGKSHTQDVLKDYCLKKNIPFAELSHDDFEAVDMLRYMIDLANVDGVVLFCGCQTKFYDRLIKIRNVCIIGGGHGPSEIKELEAEFKIFDMEKDYPLTADDIYAILTTTLKKITLESIISIPNSFLKEVSQMTNNPGLALDALGACLAVVAYKAKTGKCPKITQEDIRYCCDRRFIRWLSGFRKPPN